MSKLRAGMSVGDRRAWPELDLGSYPTWGLRVCLEFRVSLFGILFYKGGVLYWGPTKGP